MKAPSYALLLTAALVLGFAHPAFAAEPGDGGTDPDGASSSDDAAGDESDMPASNELVLRCDGALCDTTTGGTPCSIAGGVGSKRPAPIAVMAIFAAIGVGTLRRRAHRAKEQTR